MRPTCLTILLAHALAGASAEPTVPIEVLAGREVTLKQTDPSQTTFEASVPVRCNPPGSFNKWSLQTIFVTHKGQVLDPGTVWFCRGKNLPEFILKVNLKKAAAAGTYTVKARPTPAEDGVADLEFTLTRPAAELQTATPIRLERVVCFPWCCATTGPDPILLTEKSAQSVLLLDGKVRYCDLLADGRPAGRLTLTLPEAITAGGQGAVGVKVAEPPPLGKSAGTLRIHSAQLATGVAEVPIELTCRVALGWLLFVLAAGIGTGYFTRTYLEKRRQWDLALIAAHERLEALKELVKATADEGLKSGLQLVVEELQEKIRTVKTPESLTGAVANAASNAEERLNKAEANRAELGREIAEQRTAIDSRATQPAPIRPLLEKALAELTEAATDLRNGLIAPVKKKLDEQGRWLPARLREEVDPWLLTVQLALRRMDAWPETHLPQAAKRVHDSIAALPAPGRDNLSSYLSTTAQLRLDLANSLLTGAVASIVTQANDVLTNLPAPGNDSLKARLQQLEKAIKAVNKARETATPEEFGDLAEQVLRLREVLAAALRAARPELEPARLREGRFEQALRDVLAGLPGPLPAAAERGQGAGEQKVTLTPQAALPPPEARTPSLDVQVQAKDGVEALPALHRKLRWTRLIQSLVFGALIALSGFVLYQTTFVGTVADFLTAFLWGFTVDVGVAKVTELSTPLLGRRAAPAGARPATG